MRRNKRPDKSRSNRDVNLFGVTWKMSDEERLLILVMTAGALGSLVHALRSAYWYVGNRNLVRSWIPKYLLLPFCGAILAILFYFVVRGGFFSPRANSMDTSQYGFCALACLVGLFSEQAVLKLKQIAETVFVTTEQGKDANPPAAEAKRKMTNVRLSSAAQGHPEATLRRKLANMAPSEWCDAPAWIGHAHRM